MKLAALNETHWLKQAETATAHPKCASWLMTHHRESIGTVKSFLTGNKPLATASKGPYTVAIMSDGRMLYLKKGWEPAPAGLWMDFPEEHWGIGEDDYRALPRKQRAALEAQEQLRYIEEQFYDHWVRFYLHDEFDKMWWQGWKDLGWKKLNQEAKKLALKRRSTT
jgi:hypothetical protein